MRAWLTVLIFMIGAFETHAEQIPTSLRGKSLALSWSDSRTVRDAAGNQKNVDQTSAIKLYVSDVGRVFSQFDRQAGRGSKTLTQVSGAPDNYLHWRFEGGALTADQQFSKGARRVAISFSDSFRACAIQVLHGKQVGAQTIHYRDYSTDVDYEILTIAVTSTSCSIQEGNVFGGSQ
jgi:hypothetical protein